jgi:hypothetical protein
MASRIQGLILGLGKDKQAAVGTASTDYIRFKKLDNDITTPKFVTENDAAEIGKGHEFAETVYPVSNDFSTKVEKYGTSEFTAWAWAFGLGDVTESGSSPSVYTCIPQDSNTLDLPLFSVVAQLAEGSGQSIDNLYYDCAIEDVEFHFSYGPGRQSTKVMATLQGSGKSLTPSGITIPALTTEHHMKSQSMALTVNGVDYVANKNILSGVIGWKNNIMLGPGYFPGSGEQNGAAIRGRMEMGLRGCSFTFKARLDRNSTEYTKLLAQTTGTAVLNVQFDADNSAQWTFHKISYAAVDNGDEGGIASVSVVVMPQKHPTDGLLTFVGTTGISGIAQ